MINFLCGPPCSGLGFIEAVLSRSAKIQIKSLLNGIGSDFVFDAECKYIVYNDMLSMKKYAVDSLVIMRCPFSSFLSLLEMHYNRLERDLTDEEIDFHGAMFNKKLIAINSLISNGASYFVIKNDSRLIHRMNDLIEMICGDRLFTDEDLQMFYESLSTNRYISMDSFSRENRREIERMGTMYGKYGIELEI